MATCNQKIRAGLNPEGQIIHQDIASGGHNLNLGATSLLKHYKHNIKSTLMTYLDIRKFNVVSFTYAVSTCFSLQ